MLVLVSLLFAAAPQASADDRFYAENFNMEPGTSRTIGFVLDNSQDFIGFQADFVLPEGLEVVMDGSSPQCSLSSRTDDTYSLFSNVLTDGTVRIGAFSMQNTPIQGNSGELLAVGFTTSDTFVGGVLSIKNIRFVDINNRDVILPDVDVDINTQYVNNLYINDFNIAVGETKTVSVILDNEQEFTAFQSDIYLPEGLSVVPNSFTLTSRADGHSISSKDFGDGRVRIACFSTANANISGDEGALVTFDVTADKDVSETAVMELRNTIFTTDATREVRLPNTSCNVTTERAFVETIILSQTELSLTEGQTAALTATVLPEYASTRDVVWKSSDEDVATVSATGEVKALKAGKATITCSSVDGSGVSATCEVMVTQVLVSSIRVEPSQVSFKVSETSQLVASVMPENASNKTLNWSSSDETVATVDEAGKVTAIKEGNAVVTVSATDGSGVKAEVNVIVVPTLAERVALDKASLSLKVNGTAVLSATVYPETATDKSLNWSSSNNDVATVSSDGLVTALSLGEAMITATAADGSGVSATCVVTVGETQAEGVSITAEGQTTLKAGGTVQLRATVTPETATDKSVTWHSSNDKIATVDAEGLVTAVGVGTATITCTNSAGQTATINVTVEATQAEGVSITAEGQTTLKTGGTVQLRATVTPETATDKSVTWRSSDERVATVDAEGLVTAVGVGTATITCTNSAGQTAKINVTVEATPVTSITLNRITAALKVSGSLQLEATVQPGNATDKGVNWSSSNSEVATVTADGFVTALSLGEAMITATAADGSGVSATCVVTVGETQAEGVSITAEGQTTLKAGGTVQLRATVTPETATDKSVTWRSSDDKIATVDSDGLVTAVGVGTATITCTNSAGQTATVNVTVEATPVTSITLNRTTATLKVSGSLQLEATVQPDNATDKGVNWTSSNNEVATVTADGLVTALSLGEAMITATAADGSGVSATCVVTVGETQAEGVSITVDGPTTLKAGGTVQLRATITPETATDKSVTWRSSDDKIATVSTEGLVTAVGVGTATITCTNSAGQTATVNITVEPTPVSSITLNRTTAALKVTGSLQLEATVQPDNATNKGVNWTSSNNEVATVTAEGLVTAQSLGEAIITVTAADGSGVIASCVVTVEPMMVSSVSLSETSAKLNKGENLTLTATVKPDDATDKSVKWTSSDEAVATVSGNGVVTATGAGTAEITATANDGSGQSATCVVTVEETVVIKWNQEFEVVAGDAVRLNAEASDGAQVAFRAVKPNGGYVIPEITNDNGVWTATFANIGAVILEAYVEGLDENVECEPVRKTFNVLPDRDVMLVDGIYYRYTDDTKTALSVTYGYRQYEGDVTVPPVAGGLPVVSVGNRAFYSNAGLTSVTLPEGLERIESDQAFGNCRQLVNVTLPSTLTYIGSYAFNSGGSLMEIHCGIEHPSDVEILGGELIFNGYVDYDNCVLYVPYGSADEYREAEVWKNFKNIVEEQREPVLAALLSLDVNDLRLNVGETAVLKPVIYPSSAENQLVTWTSSDETVATVDAYGEVLAVGAGSAVITAATNDGSGLTAQCVVTVELPSGIDAVGCDGVRIVENGRIVVTGLSADDDISVTTIGGALVYKGANVAVNVPRTGIYIVGIKGRFYKVAVR